MHNVHCIALQWLCIAHLFWIYGYRLMDTINPHLHVPQLQLVLGTLVFLGRRGKVLGNLSWWSCLLLRSGVLCFLLIQWCVYLFFIRVRIKFVLCPGQMSFILCPGRYSWDNAEGQPWSSWPPIYCGGKQQQGLCTQNDHGATNAKCIRNEWQWHVTNLSSLLPKAEKTHKGKPKPLMWSKIKQDERFRWDSNLFSSDDEEWGCMDAGQL